MNDIDKQELQIACDLLRDEERRVEQQQALNAAGADAEKRTALVYANQLMYVNQPQASPQTPSVGRIVHYVAYGTPNGEYPAGVHRAATITEVYEDGAACVLETVGLCVMNPTGLYFNRNVPHDETQKTCGSWHWPERV